MIEAFIRSLLGFMTSDESSVLRSEKLLREWLSPKQLAEFEAVGSFMVIGSNGSKFRITASSFYNVMWISPDGVELLCFAPSGLLPRYDNMLAQKIALETDEIEAVRTANKRYADGYGYVANDGSFYRFDGENREN